MIPRESRAAQTDRRQPWRRPDRATLARRLALDLTGLPPTPAEVDAFVADPTADDPLSQKEYFQLYAILNNTADADRKDEFPVVQIP